jgi:anthranilate phosphoribosyltransferase
LEEIQGGDARESAERIRRIFRGERGAPRNVVLLNAGAVLYVAGKAATFAEGVSLAADAIDSGAAARKLEQVVRMSQEVRYVS